MTPISDSKVYQLNIKLGESATLNLHKPELLSDIVVQVRWDSAVINHGFRLTVCFHNGNNHFVTMIYRIDSKSGFQNLSLSRRQIDMHKENICQYLKFDCLYESGNNDKPSIELTVNKFEDNEQEMFWKRIDGGEKSPDLPTYGDLV